MEKWCKLTVLHLSKWKAFFFYSNGKGGLCYSSPLDRQQDLISHAFVFSGSVRTRNHSLSTCNNPTCIRGALGKGLRAGHHHYLAGCLPRTGSSPNKTTGLVSRLGGSVGPTHTNQPKNERSVRNSPVPSVRDHHSAHHQSANIRSFLPPCPQATCSFGDSLLWMGALQTWSKQLQALFACSSVTFCCIKPLFISISDTQKATKRDD